MNQFIDVLFSFSGAVITVFIIILSLFVSRWIFKRIEQEKEKSTITRQVIGLIGIVISAAFAFSSTTLIGNALAGLMPI